MKRLLTILLLLFIVNLSFAQVKVGSQGDIIATGNYPVVKSGAVKGGLHLFHTIIERNSLPTNFRDTGMLAYVIDSAKFYYLNNSINNTAWTEWQGSGGGGGSGCTTFYVTADSLYFVRDSCGVLDSTQIVGDGSSGGGSSVDSTTASNGLTLIGKDVQLGGASSIGATITFSNNKGLLLRRSGVGDVSPITLDILTPSSTAIKVQSGTGTAINAISTSNTAISAISYSGTGGMSAIQGIGDNTATGVVGQSYNGMGVAAYSSFGVPLYVGSLGGNSPLITPLISINRVTGVGVNGLGASIDFTISKTDGFPGLSNQLISKLTGGGSNPTSEFSITGVNSGVTNTLITLNGDGSAKLNKYGQNLFTGTLAKSLGVDASGNVIEYDVSGGSGETTHANNGVSLSGDTVQLGGTLTKNTTITSNGYSLTINNTTNNVTPFVVTTNATSANAIEGIGTGTSSTGVSGTGAQKGVYGFSSGGYGLYGESTGGPGLFARSTNQSSGQFSRVNSSTNTVLQNLYLERTTTGTAGNGIGQLIGFTTSTSNNLRVSNELISKWTDATDATRTSEFSITGVNSATTTTLLKISGAGVFTLVQGLTNYTDNAAAITGGLTVGQLYRNGDIVQIVH